MRMAGDLRGLHIGRRSVIKNAQKFESLSVEWKCQLKFDRICGFHRSTLGVLFLGSCLDRHGPARLNARQPD